MSTNFFLTYHNPVQVKYLCPIRKCQWAYLEPPLTDHELQQALYEHVHEYVAADILSSRRAGQTHKILLNHLATHRRWRMSRAVRKAMRKIRLRGEQE